MASKPIVHGSVHSYIRYGCHCHYCTEAFLADRRAGLAETRKQARAESAEMSLRRAQRIADLKDFSKRMSDRESCGNASVESYMRGCRCSDCNYTVRSYKARYPHAGKGVVKL